MALPTNVDSVISNLTDYVKSVAADKFILDKTDPGSLGNTVTVCVNFYFAVNGGVSFETVSQPYSYGHYYGKNIVSVNIDSAKLFYSSLKKNCKANGIIIHNPKGLDFNNKQWARYDFNFTVSRQSVLSEIDRISNSNMAFSDALKTRRKDIVDNAVEFIEKMGYTYVCLNSCGLSVMKDDLPFFVFQFSKMGLKPLQTTEIPIFANALENCLRKSNDYTYSLEYSETTYFDITYKIIKKDNRTQALSAPALENW